MGWLPPPPSRARAQPLPHTHTHTHTHTCLTLSFLSQAVREEQYDAEDLDEEWAALLRDLDARLVAAGRPRLDPRERAVAIRSLIVATASQSAEAALAKAAADVDGYRRAQSFRQ